MGVFSFSLLLTLLCVTSLLAIASAQSNISASNDLSDPFLVWTSRDGTNSMNSFNVLKVDQDADSTANTKPYTKLNITSTYYTSKILAITCNFKKNEIIFADWISNVFGSITLNIFEEPVPALYQLINGFFNLIDFQGFAPLYMKEDLANLAFIENVVHDWVTGNLYWTKLDSILVGGKYFNYYVTIHKVYPNRVYGLALHPYKRLMYFSTYGNVDLFLPVDNNSSRVMVADMAGKYPRVLFTYPTVHHVTGITIDFMRNRLLFTDRRTNGSRLMSCDLNGSNLKIEYEKSGAMFKKLVSYKSTVYVTDEYMTEDKRYVIWSMTRTNSNTTSWKVQPIFTKLKPLGIAMYYNETEDITTTEDYALGSCSFSPPCDHICLPRANTTRMCVCGGSGFNKTNETICVEEFVENPSFKSDQGNEPLSGVIIFFIVLMCIVCILGVGLWAHAHYRRRGILHLHDGKETNGVFYAFVHNLTTLHYCRHNAMCHCC